MTTRAVSEVKLMKPRTLSFYASHVLGSVLLRADVMIHRLQAVTLSHVWDPRALTRLGTAVRRVVASSESHSRLSPLMQLAG